MSQFEMYLKLFLDDEDADEVRNHVDAICENCSACEYCDQGMCSIREAANKVIEVFEDKNDWMYRLYA